MSMAHFFYPAGANGPVYDMRWIVSFYQSGMLAKVRFYTMPTAQIEFDWNTFKAAWDASRAANPALPSTPVIGVAVPDLLVGNSYYNTLLIDSWVDDGTNLAINFSAGSVEEDLPLDPSVTILKATVIAALTPISWNPPNYPLWIPGTAVAYNLDNVLTWNPNPDGTSVDVRFHGSPQKLVTLPSLTAFETAMSASKARGAYDNSNYWFGKYNIRHVLCWVPKPSDPTNFVQVRFTTAPDALVEFDRTMFELGISVANP